MSPNKLSAIQERVLVALSALRPRWTLTGGGALVGFYTKHRETRDLDLFFHHERGLGSIVVDAMHALQAAGRSVTTLRTSATFAQLDVRSGAESVVVDLVADPTPITEPAQPFVVGTATIMVETPHQLLVNKLCALMSRSERSDPAETRSPSRPSWSSDRSSVRSIRCFRRRCDVSGDLDQLGVVGMRVGRSAIDDAPAARRGARIYGATQAGTRLVDASTRARPRGEGLVVAELVRATPLLLGRARRARPRAQ